MNEHTTPAEMSISVDQVNLLKQILATPSLGKLKPAILIWRFYNAPKEYQTLSTNGGDEDWLAFIPAKVWKAEGGDIMFLWHGTPFGVCDVSEYPVNDGMVLIGAHA